MFSNLALLVIDMQDFFLQKLPNPYLLRSNLEIINFCVSHGIPIGFIYCLGRGKTTKSLLCAAEPGKNYFEVGKKRDSGFEMTDLQERLLDLKSRRLILSGVYASGCVLDTALDGKKLGYSLLVSRDSISNPPCTGFLRKSAPWYTQNAKFFQTHSQLLSYLERHPKS